MEVRVIQVIVDGHKRNKKVDSIDYCCDDFRNNQYEIEKDTCGIGKEYFNTASLSNYGFIDFKFCPFCGKKITYKVIGEKHGKSTRIKKYVEYDDIDWK